MNVVSDQNNTRHHIYDPQHQTFNLILKYSTNELFCFIIFTDIIVILQDFTCMQRDTRNNNSCILKCMFKKLWYI